MSFKSIEDILCWQKARDLSILIFNLTKRSNFKLDYKHVNQIRAATGSGMDNIAEGFGRGGDKEFIQFLYISIGSINEVKSQLYRGFDKNYINENEFKKAIQLSNNTISITYALINYLKNSNLKGSKFKLKG